MNAGGVHSMRLAELLPDAVVPASLAVTGLVQDSRAVRAGDAFVALPAVPGSVSRRHGLAFAAQARAAGAVAILFEAPAPAGVEVPADAIAVPRLGARLGELGDRFHGRPSRAMTMVGVTGTNGKTSTVQLLAQAWTLWGQRGASVGTLGAGLHGQVRATGFTTPQVLQVHQLLAELRDAGAQAVAMEVSSHALVQGRVDAVHFDVAVFTNLSRDHLDYHGDMAAYGAAKALLFAWPGLQAAVVNLDDAFGRSVYAALPEGVRRIGFAMEAGAHDASAVQEAARVQARGVHLDATGIRFELWVDGQAHPVRSALLGRFNVANLLAVASVLHAQDMPAARIAELLSQLQPVHGRMNRLGGDGTWPLVVVDYAHTPDALAQALESLRGHVRARLICVFGCGGERDAGKRPLMAAAAESAADVVIVTDDNPRGEDGDAIVADILAGFVQPQRVTVQRDRAAAITRAVGQAGPGDIVLIAGKGHEPYQEVEGVRHPFDDTQVARHALEARA